MVTFSAYFDESGTSDPSPILVVAGFLSTDRQWNRFDAEWKGMLDLAMPTVRHEQRHFHLMHWRRRRKQFEGWTPGKCPRIAAQACTIVKNRTRHCVAAGVNRADHKRLGIPFHGISGPYAFCAIRCLESMREWLNDNAPHAKVAYRFEAGARGADELALLMDTIAKSDDARRHFRLSEWSFGSKHEWRPLQPADILAAESQRYLVRTAIEGLMDFKSAWIPAMVRHRTGIVYYDAEELRKIIRTGVRMVRVE